MTWRTEAREFTIPFAVFYMGIAAVLVSAFAEVGRSGVQSFVYTMPASYWLDFEDVRVSDFRQGSLGYVTGVRTSRDVRSTPVSEVRAAGEFARTSKRQQWCAGSHPHGPFEYGSAERRRRAMTLDEWVGFQGCSGALPCGEFALFTKWPFKRADIEKAEWVLTDTFRKTGCKSGQ